MQSYPEGCHPGRLVIPELWWADGNFAHQVLACMVPVKVDMNWMGRTFEVYAYSADFQPVGEGAEIPGYSLDVEEVELPASAKIVRRFKRFLPGMYGHNVSRRKAGEEL